MMKVLMIGRATLFSHPGGDTVQLSKTAEYLNDTKEVEVDVATVEDDVNFTSFDLIHLFNICRPADLLGVIKKAKKKYVVSTIFVDYSEAEKNHFIASRRFLSKILSFNQLEYLKSLARIVKGQDKLTHNSYVFKGHKTSLQKIIKNAEILLPNSKSEYDRLFKAYGVEQDYKVIPNAIDLNIFSSQKSTSHRFDKFDNTVITVGQITPVKNQLNIIKALKETKFNVFIIGSPSLNAIDYYEKCKEEASSNIKFISHLKQDELAEVYKRAKTHVLASWFETTGLVSLEAAYSGCNIVISNRGDQPEYFKNNAFYCNPSNVRSIREAVEKAYKSKFNENFKLEIEEKYNWSQTAKLTLSAYKRALKHG